MASTPCDFLEKKGSITPQELLKQCIEFQNFNNCNALLSRSFQVLRSEDSGKEGYERNASSIRVMQWNVLADALCTGADNFIKCPNDALKWDARRISILREILSFDPDILCLQEVDHYADFFQPQLERVGYHGSFKPKPDSPCLDCWKNNGPDGCALFYKSAKFSLVSKIAPVLRIVEDGNTWTTNQVAIIMKLRCADDGKTFVVGTTHLKAKKNYEDLRYLQGLDLLGQIAQHSGGHPVVFGGDFNGDPTEKIYDAFESSEIGLHSVNTHLSADGLSEPPFTSWKIRPAGEVCQTIDYLWYSRKLLKPVAVLKCPSSGDIGPERLPSYRYPSDHLSQVADFSFK